MSLIKRRRRPKGSLPEKKRRKTRITTGSVACDILIALYHYRDGSRYSDLKEIVARLRYHSLRYRMDNVREHIRPDTFNSATYRLIRRGEVIKPKRGFYKLTTLGIELYQFLLLDRPTSFQLEVEGMQKLSPFLEDREGKFIEQQLEQKFEGSW